MRRFLTVLTVILTVVFLIAGCTGSNDTAEEPTTAAPASTVAPPETVTAAATTVAPPETVTTAAAVASATLSEADAIATVKALQDALNAYDADAAFAFYDEWSADIGGSAGRVSWEQFLALDGVVGMHGTLSGCELVDGELRCLWTQEETRLSGKAGVVFTYDKRFAFTEEGLVLGTSWEELSGSEDKAAFETAFGDWMATAHPEAYERFYVAAFDSKNEENWTSREGVAELSLLIDEFVAQSDEYPLSRAVSTAAGTATSGDVPSLTFDGESCTYAGPTELNAGPFAIDFVNATEEPEVEAWRLAFLVNLMKHKGDQTIQDMIDYIGPEPSTGHQPSWVSNPQPAPWNYPAVFPGKTVTWEGNLEPGTYTMVCALTDPHGVWFGTGLTVEE